MGNTYFDALEKMQEEDDRVKGLIEKLKQQQTEQAILEAGAKLAELNSQLAISQYQKLANRTFVLKDWQEDEKLTYAILGLTAEAGEVANKYKKVIRGDYGVDEIREALADEIGDVLWYVAAVCTALSLDLSEVGQANLEKLADRAQRGVIMGEGDKR
jgi:NTP pyrophosphatase (non-canonical NTP hydrolase)